MMKHETLTRLALDQHKGEINLFEAGVHKGSLHLPEDRPADVLLVTGNRADGQSFYYTIDHLGPHLVSIAFDSELTQPLPPFKYKKPVLVDSPLYVNEEWEDRERHGYYPLAIVRKAVRNPHHWHREDEAVVCAVQIDDHWETRFFPRQNLSVDTWKNVKELLRKQIHLQLFSLDDAKEIFELIDRNGEHLSQFGDVTASKYPTYESVVESIVRPRNLNKLRYAIRNGLGELVGSINLTPDEENSQKAEIGYYLGSEFQGYGYMTKAIEMLTEQAMEEMGYTTLYGVVHIDNAASVKVLQRAGYIETDRNPRKRIFTRRKMAVS